MPEVSTRYLNSGCLVGFAGALNLATGRMLQNGFQNRYVKLNQHRVLNLEPNPVDFIGCHHWGLQTRGSLDLMHSSSAWPAPIVPVTS